MATCKTQSDTYMCTLFIEWSFVPNGSIVRKSIEELLMMWTDCSRAVCLALVGVGGLKAIADNIMWALNYEVISEVSELLNGM